MLLAQRCCHCWKYFRNSCYGTVFSAIVTYLQYPEIFILLRQTYFCKQPEVIRKQIRGTGWVLNSLMSFFFHKLLDRESPVSRSIVTVEIQSLGKSSRFFYAQLHVTASIFPNNRLGLLFGLVH